MTRPPSEEPAVRPLVAALSVPLLLAPAFGADDPRPVSAAEAVKLVGRPEVVIEMVVKKAKDRTAKRGIVFLDSEEDFKDPRNLGVAVSAGAAEKFRARGISDPAAHFLGKTVRVRGCVMVFEERPYLPVLDPDQIRVVGAKP